MFCECTVYDGSENCGKKYITVTRMISFEYFRYFHFDKSGKGGGTCILLPSLRSSTIFTRTRTWGLFIHRVSGSYMKHAITLYT